jgi:hypothetical protein
MPEQLGAEDVKRKLALILEEGSITYTDHCKNESMPDRNVTTQDVEFVLESGRVVENARWSGMHCNWEYRIQGTDIEGEELEAVFVIIEGRLMARIITVF